MTRDLVRAQELRGPYGLLKRKGTQRRREESFGDSKRDGFLEELRFAQHERGEEENLMKFYTESQEDKT